MTDSNRTKITRLDLGEAWMWCTDCNAKLYSFDGFEDKTCKCPHPQKCEAEAQIYRRIRSWIN